MSITIYSHPSSFQHDTGTGHPESPERVRVILERLHKSAISQALEFTESPLCSEEQIMLAHSRQHLDRLKTLQPVSGRVSLDADTSISAHSLEAAYRASGAVCEGIDQLLTGRTDTVFCVTRPPGHHATRDTPMGFCLLNQVAIGALYARGLGLEKVVVIDFDVHHGNGSQDILQQQRGILYISTHQSPLYPGTGHPGENIDGNIINIPLHTGTTHSQYMALLKQELLPQAELFQPDLVLVSAGFDAHGKDPLASLQFTEETYYELGISLKRLALKYASGRLLASLEGGYELHALANSVESFIAGLNAAAQPD